MKCKNNDMARHVRVRAVVAYPALSATLVVSIALALTSFGPSQVIALADTPAPSATGAPTAPAAPAAPAAPSATAPATAAATAPGTASTSAATPSPTAIPSASGGVVTPGVPVDHHLVARIEGSGLQAHYLALDAAMNDVTQFQTLRLRFKIHNAAATTMTAAPQLEYRAFGSTGYTVVPEKMLNGIPFRVDREWVPSLTPGGGTKQGPLGELITVGKFLTGSEGGGLAVPGHHSMGANPDQPITLVPGTYTEQEFTVQVTTDAKNLTGYEFRITNGHAVLAGTQVATILLGAAPALTLSPGQQTGLRVAGPTKSSLPTAGTVVAK